MIVHVTRRLLRATILTALLTNGAQAQVLPGVGQKQVAREPQSGEDAVKVSFAVVGEARPGATVRVAATFDIVPDWHIYWENPGESGAPTQFEVELPQGCEVATSSKGRPRPDFPVPSVFTHGETVFGYEKSVTLSLEVRLPEAIPPGGLPAVARASWLVCKERCLMGSAQGSIDLTKPVARDAKAAIQLADSLARRPKPLPGEWKVSLEEVSAERAVLVFAGPESIGTEKPWQFIPADTPGVLLESGYLAEAKGRVLRVPLAISRENSLGKGLEAAGLIVLGKNGPAYSFTVPVPGK